MKEPGERKITRAWKRSSPPEWKKVNEQHAGQQIQNEIVQGFKNEENARKLVQNELAVMKDELKDLKMGSFSAVCSEASTRVGLGSGIFAGHPATHFSLE